MIIQYLLVSVAAITSLVSDIKTYRIKNCITIPFAVAGAAVNFFEYGSEGLRASIAGWLVPVALLFLLYRLKMLGAGDVKLFGAIGAAAGWKFAVHCIAYSFLFGGIAGIILIAVRKNGRQRFKNLYHYLKSCLLTFKLLDYQGMGTIDNGGKFRFAYAIVSAVFTQICLAAAGS